MTASALPALVLDLQRRNVPHVFRPSSGDVIVSCPACGSRMTMDASKPYWLCLGQRRCTADAWSFDQVVQALGQSFPAKGEGIKP